MNSENQVKEVEIRYFYELNKKDIFQLERALSFGTMRVIDKKDDFFGKKRFLISLQDRNQIIIDYTVGHWYNQRVVILSKYEKRTNNEKNNNKIKRKRSKSKRSNKEGD